MGCGASAKQDVDSAEKIEEEQPKADVKPTKNEFEPEPQRESAPQHVEVEPSKVTTDLVDEAAQVKKSIAKELDADNDGFVSKTEFGFFAEQTRSWNPNDDQWVMMCEKIPCNPLYGISLSKFCDVVLAGTDLDKLKLMLELLQAPYSQAPDPSPETAVATEVDDMASVRLFIAEALDADRDGFISKTEFGVFAERTHTWNPDDQAWANMCAKLSCSSADGIPIQKFSDVVLAGATLESLQTMFEILQQDGTD